MFTKQITVAIVGLGARGLDTYAAYQKLRPETMKIVAVADTNPAKVKVASEEYKIEPSMCFASAEELLDRAKLADAIFIATPDRQHITQVLRALDLGYDILLEKPIAVAPSECIRVRDKATELGKAVTVCHVLRYTDFYATVKRAIEDGEIGRIITVQASENVGYWHQAHSFVRGNWNNSIEASPMVLQKCCHDFDIFQWLVGTRCKSVSSFGGLTYFKEANAPNGSAPFCASAGACRAECPFDAEKIYLRHKDIGLLEGNTQWPCNVVAYNPNEKSLMDALKNGNYGRCVFRCGNDVVDHQVVILQFEDEVTVSFNFTGFTDKNYRTVRVMGTLGEVIASTETNIITVTKFGQEPRIININDIAEDLSGHGGGDNRMLDNFFRGIGTGTGLTETIEDSIESHLIAFAAEQSRLTGKTVNMKEFEQSIKAGMNSI